MTPLSDTDVAEIRRLAVLAQLRLAKRYGISPEAVDAIVRGRPWRRLVGHASDVGLGLGPADDLLKLRDRGVKTSVIGVVPGPDDGSGGALQLDLGSQRPR
jgi:hypothetical protein